MFNPEAAKGRASRVLGQLRARMDQRGISARVLTTAHPGHGQALVSGCTLHEYDAVVAAGGDGTLFDVLNGVMDHPLNRRPPLGLIPLGTGNAFSRDIGLNPGAWPSAVDAVAARRTRRIDVGLFEDDNDRCHFLNIAGFGLVTEAGRTSARLKTLGRSAYTLGALWHAMLMRSTRVSLRVDGREIVEHAVFVEISNSRYTGTSFLIAPQARVDDGELDVVILRRLPRIRLLRLFPTIYSGRHVEYEEVATLRGAEIFIEAPAGLEGMIDGEFRGRTPARIRCLPSQIEMIVA